MTRTLFLAIIAALQELKGGLSIPWSSNTGKNLISRKGMFGEQRYHPHSVICWQGKESWE